MTEMKELYPKLPTAPPIEDQGQGYRLQKISEIQAFLEKEVEERGKLSKKCFRAAKIVDSVDSFNYDNHRSRSRRYRFIVNDSSGTSRYSDRRSGTFYGSS